MDARFGALDARYGALDAFFRGSVRSTRDSCGLMWDSCRLMWDSCRLMWDSCGLMLLLAPRTRLFLRLRPSRKSRNPEQTRFGAKNVIIQGVGVDWIIWPDSAKSCFCSLLVAGFHNHLGQVSRLAFPVTLKPEPQARTPRTLIPTRLPCAVPAVCLV